MPSPRRQALAATALTALVAGSLGACGDGDSGVSLSVEVTIDVCTTGEVCLLAPVPGASVRVEGGRDRTLVTDDSGTVELDLDPGHYVVEADWGGRTGTADAAVSEDGFTTVEIRLQPAVDDTP